MARRLVKGAEMLPANIEIRDYLAELIASGQLRSDEKLPSERVLVEQFNSTRITVRDALSKLESEGLIYRSNRRGWFVAPSRLVYDPSSRVNFYLLAAQQNKSPATQLISQRCIKGPAEARLALGLKDKEKVIELVRLRSLDGRPVLFEFIYLPELRFPKLNKARLEGSLTTLMEDEYHVKITHEDNRITVSAVYDQVAESLQHINGAPCLEVVRTRYEADHQAFEFDKEYWVHSAIELSIPSK